MPFTARSGGARRRACNQWVAVPVLLALWCAGAGAAPPDSTATGLVADIKGRWRVSGAPNELKRGDMLAPTAVIEALPDQPGPLKIVVARLDAAGAVTRGRASSEPPLALECATAAACARLTMPPARPADDAWSRLTDAIAAVLGRNYRRYRTTLPRALEKVPDVREAVLALDGRTLDLGPALEHVAAGSYQLELLPAPEPAEAPPVSARITWVPGTRAPLPDLSLSPGLYELALALPEPEAPAGRAWVWICAAAAAGECRARFTPAVEWAAGLEGTADAGVMRAFLRSALEHLATGSR